MSYVTIIWSSVAACAFLLALMYGYVWLVDRKALSSLAFACLALAIAATGLVELGTMQSTTAAEWGEWVRWSQVPVFVRIAATVAFIRLYFGTGRTWLIWTIMAMRLGILVASFLVDPNFNFERIDSIDRMTIFGQDVAVVGHAVPGRWQWIATLAGVLLLIYIADASLKLWRSGMPDARRRALIVGVAILVSATLAMTYTQLLILVGLKIPALLTPPYLIMFLVMAIEMSRNTLHASRLARELRVSEARLEFAASAAGFGLWVWDVEQRKIWATHAARDIFEVGTDDPLEVELLRRRVHADDIGSMRKVLDEATASGDEHELHFRINRTDGSTRWINALGRCEADGMGRVSLIRGVLRDVTDQFRTRQENEELRRDLAHAGRVSVLGTLSSSLAHELGQPLGAIMLNTETAQILLRKPNPDLEELRLILADIQRDDRRAAEVIDRLRSLLKRRQMDFSPVPADGLVQELAALLRTDAIGRNVTLDCSSDAGMPMIRGDRVHLSQVLMNLVINGMDSVADLPVSRRRVSLRAKLADPDRVEFAVTDSGPGISAETMLKIFDPFFSTKPTGMGMGLPISKTIVDAHGGRIWAESEPGQGATFRIMLPISE